MRIAALYDIHGNLPALNAALDELQKVQPDLIVVGGDIVSGPLPAQTLERLLQIGDRTRFIRGNNDREVVLAFDNQPVTRKYLPAPSEKGREEMRWTAGQLTRSQRDFLAALPERFEAEIDGLGRVLFCHATPSSDEEVFTPITPEERLKSIFSGVEQEIVICGHTHMQFELRVNNLRVNNLRVLNAGSVGMPFSDQPGAYWLLLSPEGCEFRRTVYDAEAAAREIRASGSPQGQEFIQAFIEENVLKLPSAAVMTENLERIARTF